MLTQVVKWVETETGGYRWIDIYRNGNIVASVQVDEGDVEQEVDLRLVMIAVDR
jgi:hypothetical protein